MEFKEYFNKAMDMPMYHPNPGNNLPYAVLGLIGEFGELEEKIENHSHNDEILKELGDVIWYLCLSVKESHSNGRFIRCSSWFEQEFQNPMAFWRSFINILDIAQLDMPFILKEMRKVLFVLSENVKKRERMKGSDGIDIEDNLLKMLLLIFLFCDKQKGFNLAGVLNKNIDKLNKRIAQGSIVGSGDNR